MAPTDIWIEDDFEEALLQVIVVKDYNGKIFIKLNKDKSKRSL